MRLLLWALLALATRSTRATSAPDCISATSWYDVCNFNSRICVVSSAICNPYGSLFDILVNGPQIAPTKDLPWSFLVDPIYRLNANSPTFSSNYEQCEQGLTASQCIQKIYANSQGWDEAMKETIKVAQLNAFHGFSDHDILQNTNLRLNSLNIAQLINNLNLEDQGFDLSVDPAYQLSLQVWNFSYANFKPDYNYLTIRSLGNDIARDKVFPAVFISLSRDISASDDGFPKCRVFDISTHHVTLYGMVIFTGKCFQFYQAPEQVFGDDGTTIAFSGASAVGSHVKKVIVETLDNYVRGVGDSGTEGFGFLSPESYPLYTQSGTALRIAKSEYGVIDASEMVIDMTTINVNASVMLYDYKASVSPSMKITCGNRWTQQQSESVSETDPKIPCNVFYKLGFQDTRAPTFNFAEALYSSETSVPFTQAINISDIVPPEFAFFKPSSIRYHRDAHACRCAYNVTGAITAALGVLVAILCIILVAWQLVKFHRDTNMIDIRLLEKSNYQLKN